MTKLKHSKPFLRDRRKVWRWNADKEKYELTALKWRCLCGECEWCKAKLNVEIERDEE